jgi:hypothetical protein
MAPNFPQPLATLAQEPVELSLITRAVSAFN